MFGSLERGLDKVISMLTPNKRRALRDGPRKIKVHESHPPYLFYPTELVVHITAFLLLSFFFFLLGTVQCDTDQSDQPRPGS